MNQLSGKFDVAIGKKNYKCHLSMNAFRILCEKEGLKFNEMQTWMNENPLVAVPKMIYYGLVNHIHFSNGDLSTLPALEYVSAHILESMEDLEAYSNKIAIAFGGEDSADQEGKK